MIQGTAVAILIALWAVFIVRVINYMFLTTKKVTRRKRILCVPHTQDIKLGDLALVDPYRCELCENYPCDPEKKVA